MSIYDSYQDATPGQSDQLDALDKAGVPFTASVKDGQLQVNKLKKTSTPDVLKSFDWAAARKNYSDSEILDGLYKTGAIPFDLNAARSQGYSDAEIADTLSAKPAPVKPATFGDYGKQFGASALDSFGFAAQAGGELLAKGLNKAFETDQFRAINPLSPVTDTMRDSMTEGGKVASADGFKGDVFSPSTISLPETGAGLAMQFVQGLGSVASMVVPGAVALRGGSALAVAGTGAVFGGATTAGAAISDIRENFSKLKQENWDEMPAYVEAINKGMSDAQAKRLIEDDAAQIGGALSAIAGAAGGAFNAKFLDDMIAKKGMYLLLGKVSDNMVGRTAAGAVGGAITEGFQEGLEKVGQNAGENIGMGLPAGQNVTRDTAGDVFGGMMVGGAMGGGGGVIAKRHTPTASEVGTTGDVKKDLQEILNAPVTQIGDAPDVNRMATLAETLKNAPLKEVQDEQTGAPLVRPNSPVVDNAGTGSDVGAGVPASPSVSGIGTPSEVSQATTGETGTAVEAVEPALPITVGEIKTPTAMSDAGIRAKLAEEAQPAVSSPGDIVTNAKGDPKIFTTEALAKLYKQTNLTKRPELANYEVIGANGQFILQHQEKRADALERKRVADMSPEERAKALLTDDLTGLPNRRAYDESDRLPVQARVDLDGFKAINDTFGHGAGDEVLKKAASHFQSSQGDGRIFRIGGDEFPGEFHTEEQAKQAMETAREKLGAMKFTFDLPDGSQKTITGVGFSYGIGQDANSAETALIADKTTREQAGLRRPRDSSLPQGNVQSAEGQQTGEGGVDALDAAGARSPDVQGRATAPKLRRADGPAGEPAQSSGTSASGDGETARGVRESISGKRDATLQDSVPEQGADSGRTDSVQPTFQDLTNKDGSTRTFVSEKAAGLILKAKNKQGELKGYAPRKVGDKQWVLSQASENSSIGAAPGAKVSEKAQPEPSLKDAPTLESVTTAYQEAYKKHYPDQAREVKNFSKMAEGFANAVVNKDTEYLHSVTANGQNKAQVAAFENITGIKLPKTQSGMRQAIDAWAGVTSEQRATKDSEKIAANKAKFENSQREHRAEKASKEQVSHAGKVMNGKQFIDEQIAKGFDRVEGVKQGVATKYYLVNKEGLNWDLPNRTLYEYAKDAVADAEKAAQESDGAQTETAAPKDAAITPETGKAPESMSRGEFYTSRAGKMRAADPKMLEQDIRTQSDQQHLDFIESALEAGQTVPDSALAGYDAIDAKEYPLASARRENIANEEGQNDELDAEMRSYEAKAEQRDMQHANKAGNVEKTPEKSASLQTANSKQPPKNTIFTEDAADKARAILRAKLRGTLNSGLDPELMQAGITLAGYHIEKGARTFAAYSKAMIEDLGDTVKPYLKSWYMGVKFDPRAANFEGMDSASSVEAASEKALDNTSEKVVNTDSGNENDATTQRDSPKNDFALDAGQPEVGIPKAENVRGARQPRKRPGRSNDGSVRDQGGLFDAGNDASEDLGNGSGTGDVSNGPSGTVAGSPKRVSSDYRPGAGSLTREGSWFDTAKRNIDLIDLARQIESENRKATPEEQAQLAKYVGFGAGEIRNNLFPVPPEWAKRADPTRKIWPEHTRDARWKAQAERIAALPKEWQDSVLQSTQYAHYTSEGIIRSIWSAMQRLGFTGGKIFEPGSGIGSFSMLMPDEVHQTSKFTGVEFDGPTALISRLLSPEQNMLHADFIKRKFPKNFYDVAVGNPPFAQTPIFGDPDYEKHGFMIHDFFFAKAIDRVRPGGLLTFVTSKGTMDKQNDKARKYLSERADLIGAVRLPSTAFEDNAGTSVVTDVLFLRKRLDGEAPAGQAWAGLKTVETKDGPTPINEYFANNPNMVLGQHRISGNTDDMGRRINSNGMGGAKYTVVSYDSTPAELDAKFAKAIESLPQNVYSPLSQDAASVKRETAKMDFNPKVIREGVIYTNDAGVVHRVENGVGVPLDSLLKLTPRDKEWFKGYTGLRDLVNEHRLTQLEDGNWVKSLAKLNKAYDAFVKEHGPILDYRVQVRKSTDEDGNVVSTESKVFKNRRLFREDYDQAIVTTLETINEAGEIVKSPLLKVRTIGKPVTRDVKSIGDALAVSLDSIGHLDLDDVGRRIGLSRAETIEAMGSQVYETPDGKWQLADEYLSGDVVSKLEEANQAVVDKPELQRNIDALIKAQPEKLGPSQISVKLGAPWVPASAVNEFAEEIGAGKVSYHPKTESWQVEGGNQRTGRNASAEYGTAARSPSELLESILNSRTIKIMAKTTDGKQVVDQDATTAASEMAKKIREKFKSWVWTDSERATDLVEAYNHRYNNIAPRAFDGSHLTLPGVSLRFNLHPHQLRAIWRVIQTGNTYLAHAVGAGKTIEMIAAGMEQKRLGLIKKPMYVVPNHMLEQFANEFMELYPLANVMVADDENFSAERRKAFVAAATLNGPDAIVITHDAYQRIGIKEESIAPIRDEILTDLELELSETAKDQGARVRRSQLEQQIEAVKQRFDRIVGAGGKDSTIKFEDIGVDFVFADEAHVFRKLDFHTAQSIKGIDPNGSKRALDMYVKTRWLDKQNPGRSMVFASGTPVTNTMGELYTIMRFFAGDELNRAGISTFDSWARMFGEVASALEPNAAGKYELVERFAKFDNVPELMSRVRQFMDVLTSEHLGALVKRPDLKGGKPNLIVVEATDALKSYQEGELAKRLEISRKWKPSKDQPGNPDPVVAIITDGRFAALDPRFFGAKFEPGTETILTKMASNVVDTYKATANNVYYTEDGKPEPIKGSTQIVFYNLGFGEQAMARRGFNAREAFTKQLIEGGVKREHIAWFDDANTDAKKEAVFKGMRQGKIRILIGSAKKMGTGVNVQNRLIELHYQDPPWFPADVEQPHGRIIRQGNLNKEVGINWYTTKGTYQSTMWQMVGRKQRFIDQAFTGDKTMRSMDDMSEASLFEQAAAVTSGDPRALQLAGLRQDVERFERLQSAHASEQVNAAQSLRSAEWYVDYYKKQVARYTEAFKQIGERYFSFTSGTVGKKKYEKVGEFGQAVKDAFNQNAADAVTNPKKDATTIATLGDNIKVVSTPEIDRDKGPTGTHELDVQVANVSIRIANGAGLGADVDAVGLGRKVVNAVNSIDGELRQAQKKVTDNETDTIKLRKKLGAPFEYQQEMVEKHGQLKALEEELRQEGLAAKETAQPATTEPPALRRGTDNGTLTAHEVNRFLSPVMGNSAYPVHIVDTPKQVTNAVGYDIPSDALGAAVKGEIYIVAGNIHSQLEAEKTYFHEMFHIGVRAKKGLGTAQYNVALQSIAAKNKNIAIEARKWMSAYGNDALQMHLAHGMTDVQANMRVRSLAIEEALANLSGEARNKINGLDHLLAVIQKFMRSLGLNKLADHFEAMTNAEALSFISDMRKSDVVRGSEFAPALSRDSRQNENGVTVEKMSYTLPDGAQYKVTQFKGTGNERQSYYRTESEANDAAERLREAQRNREEVSAIRADNKAERVRLEGDRSPHRLGLAAQRVINKRATESIRSTKEALRFEQIPERAGYCYQLAADASAAGVGDMVIGLVSDGQGGTIWHAVVMRDGAIYDPTFGKWYEPGIYESIGDGFKPYKTLTGQEVRNFIEKSGGSHPNASNQGLTDIALSRGKPSEKTLLKKYGYSPKFHFEVVRAFEAGDKVFAAHELDEAPMRIKSFNQFEGYALDQILILDKMAGQPETDIAFSRPEVARAKESAIEYTTAKVARMAYGAKSIGEFTNNPSSFNWLNRTLNTQLHKALKNPEFAKVFWYTQQFMDDVSQFASQSANLAPEILPNYGDIKNIRSTLKDIRHPLLAKQRDADIKAAGAAIFDGTMEGGGNPLQGKLYTADELKAKGLNDQAIKFYNQSREVIDTSLDTLVMSEVVRMLGDKIEIPPHMMEFLKNDPKAFRPKLMEAIQSVIDDIKVEGKAAKKESLIAGDPTIYEEVKRRQDAFQDIHDRASEAFGHADALKAAGYAPLMRFGKLFVTVKEKGETLRRSHYESRLDLNAAVIDLKKQYPNAQVTTGSISEEDFKLMKGMTPETIMLFANKLGLPMDMREAAQKYYREAVSERSALKRRIERSGTSGFSDDLPRVLAGFITSNARRTAGNYNLPLIKGAIDEIDHDHGDIRDEALKMVDQIEQPTEDAAALRGAMYAYFIGGSFASAAVNMTQPLTMTLPYLGQWGNIKAGKALMAAMKPNSQLSEKMKQALKISQEKGITDPQEVYYLYQETIRGLSSNSKFQKAMGLWSSMFSMAENLNRRTTFLAAYDMWEHADAETRANMTETTKGRAKDGFTFAQHVVQETQGIYNKCVDFETEILTASGWKNVDQLVVGEPIYSIDSDGALVSDVIQEIHRYEGSQDVIELRNSNGLSIVTTAAHDNLIQSYSSRDKNWGKLRKVKTGDLKNWHHLLRAPLSDRLDRQAIYTDDEVRLFAWVAGEGHLFAHRGSKEKLGVGLVQSARHNPHYVLEIDELLDRLGGHYNRKTGRGGEMVCWQLRKPLWSKLHQVLPGKMLTHKLVSQLTVPQMEIFVETFTKADGHFPKVGGQLITQKDIGNLNVLQAMAVLIGRSSTVYERMGEHNFGALYVAKNSIRSHVKAMVSTKTIVDMVWCPQTVRGTWIARRNGRTFVTGNSNRANWARGPIGSTVFTFKQYSVAYLELLSRLPKQQQMLMLAILVGLSGLGGLPGEEDAEDIIDTLGQAMGYNANTKMFIRQKANDLLGESLAPILLQGVSGMPGSPVDVGGRLGMANLIPGTAMFKRSDSGTMGKSGFEAFGPIGGVVDNAMKAAKALESGNYADAMGNLAPVAVGNVIKGAKIAQTGAATDYKERITVGDLGLSDAFFQSIGFQPKKKADESRSSRMVGQDVRLLKSVESDIVQKMAEGIAKGDDQKYQEGAADYEDWNEKNPDTPIKITMKQIRERAKQMMLERDTRQLKAIPKENRGYYADMLR